jgi:hypothetical protein
MATEIFNHQIFWVALVLGVFVKGVGWIHDFGWTRHLG